MQPNARNSFGNDEWRLEKVDDFSIFIDFECGDSDLDDFIRHDAIRCHKTSDGASGGDIRAERGHGEKRFPRGLCQFL